MARTEIIVLGAGIVGVSTALHLVKRGLSVALIDRDRPGMGTSYGNAGILEGQTVFPIAFPDNFLDLARIALKRSPQANYHLGYLPRVAPWLMALRRSSTRDRLVETARLMRPLFGSALDEHEMLMKESGAEQYLRKTGSIKVYRDDAYFAGTAFERSVADELGVPHRVLSTDEARELEPSLNPVFRHAVHWQSAASISNPLALTRAYLARFTALGGLTLTGDARTLHRTNGRWRVETENGPVDSPEAVVALGPWANDLLEPLGIRLPLEWKRGYHRHYGSRGNAGLSRPVLDPQHGYVLAPMEQGIRWTSGVEFAHRDAPPTPVQFDRQHDAAFGLYPLGEQRDTKTWMGARPCFPDSLPVIGPAPGQGGLWLAYGHGHWGLTLGPLTGRLIADLITKTAPVFDPAPFGAQRFAA